MKCAELERGRKREQKCRETAEEGGGEQKYERERRGGRVENQERRGTGKRKGIRRREE